MPTKAKKASAAGVSRALVEAGLTKSETHSTAIKGWKESTAGFRAKNETSLGEPVEKTRWVRGEMIRYTDRPWVPTGEVTVEWTDGAFPRGESRRDVELAKAKEILEAKGYVVAWTQEGGIGARRTLSVKRPEATA